MAKDIIERTHRLAGKGGVGLVMFHLSRYGMEFALTTENSHKGDLWVHVKDRIIAVEVKASFGDGWVVRPSQLGSVDFFVFVQMEDASCSIMSAADVGALLDATKQSPEKIRTLTRNRLPLAAENAWGLLAGTTEKLLPVTPRVVREGLPKRTYTSDRVVRHRLANGEVKEYRYAGRRKPNVNRADNHGQPIENAG